LRRFALDRHEAHGRALYRFTDRLVVSGVVLLPLYKRLDISWRDQPHGMAELADLASPEMRSCACLHGHYARRLRREKFQHLRSPQFLAEHDDARRIRNKVVQAFVSSSALKGGLPIQSPKPRNCRGSACDLRESRSRIGVLFRHVGHRHGNPRLRENWRNNIAQPPALWRHEKLIDKTLGPFGIKGVGFTDGLGEESIRAAAEQALADGRVAMTFIETPSKYFVSE
jgi:hypothetical protein